MQFRKKNQGEKLTHILGVMHVLLLRDDLLVSRCSFAFFKCVLLHGLIFSITTGVYYWGGSSFAIKKAKEKGIDKEIPG